MLEVHACVCFYVPPTCPGAATVPAGLSTTDKPQRHVGPPLALPAPLQKKG